MKLATNIQDFKSFHLNLEQTFDCFSKTPFKYFDFDFGLLSFSDGWEKELENSMNVAAKYGFTFVQSHACDLDPSKIGKETTLKRFEDTLKV